MEGEESNQEAGEKTKWQDCDATGDGGRPKMTTEPQEEGRKEGETEDGGEETEDRGERKRGKEKRT